MENAVLASHKEDDEETEKRRIAVLKKLKARDPEMMSKWSLTYSRPWLLWTKPPKDKKLTEQRSGIPASEKGGKTVISESHKKANPVTSASAQIKKPVIPEPSQQCKRDFVPQCNKSQEQQNLNKRIPSYKKKKVLSSVPGKYQSYKNFGKIKINSKRRVMPTKRKRNEEQKQFSEKHIPAEEATKKGNLSPETKRFKSLEGNPELWSKKSVSSSASNDSSANIANAIQSFAQVLLSFAPKSGNCNNNSGDECYTQLMKKNEEMASVLMQLNNDVQTLKNSISNPRETSSSRMSTNENNEEMNSPPQGEEEEEDDDDEEVYLITKDPYIQRNAFEMDEEVGKLQEEVTALLNILKEYTTNSGDIMDTEQIEIDELKKVLNHVEQEKETKLLEYESEEKRLQRDIYYMEGVIKMKKSDIHDYQSSNKNYIKKIELMTVVKQTCKKCKATRSNTERFKESDANAKRIHRHRIEQLTYEVKQAKNTNEMLKEWIEHLKIGKNVLEMELRRTFNAGLLPNPCMYKEKEYLNNLIKIAIDKAEKEKAGQQSSSGKQSTQNVNPVVNGNKQ